MAVTLRNIGDFLDWWFRVERLEPEASQVFNRYYRKYINNFNGYLRFAWNDRHLELENELEELKDIVLGKCTNCRRCSINCPMGVDYASFNRMALGLLVSVGVIRDLVSDDRGARRLDHRADEEVDPLALLGEDLLGLLAHPAVEQLHLGANDGERDHDFDDRILARRA